MMPGTDQGRTVCGQWITESIVRASCAYVKSPMVTSSKSNPICALLRPIRFDFGRTRCYQLTVTELSNTLCRLPSTDVLRNVGMRAIMASDCNHGSAAGGMNRDKKTPIAAIDCLPVGLDCAGNDSRALHSVTSGTTCFRSRFAFTTAQLGAGPGLSACMSARS
jgi:hypothetical protein